ncbi:MAG: glutathione S-transferase family protein [Pseudomonadota bacterium]
MANQPKILLYDAPTSPCGRRVRMCLLEKGLSAEIHWLNLSLFEQKQDWFLTINPNGTVPAALVDDRAIYESHAINGYLEALKLGRPLLPADAYAQAEVAMWQAFELAWAKPFAEIIYETSMKERARSLGLSADALNKQIAKNTTNPVYHAKARHVLEDPPDRDLIANRLAIVFERLSHLERTLEDGRTFLVGEAFSLADIAVVPRLEMFPRIGVHDLYERFPAIGAYTRRITARSSWRRSAFSFPPEENSAHIRATEPAA